MKTILKALYNSEINILIDWMWDSGIQVKIGDRINGFVAEEIFDIEDFEKIEHWVETQVKEHFPNSTFSKTYNSKYCMPDGINTKEEHEQYLKDIGYEKYIKDLEYFKEVHVGLYVVDKEMDDIFENIPDRSDCKTIVEDYLVQQIDKLKSLVWRIS